MMELRSQHLFTLTALVDPPQTLGQTPLGGRRIVTVTGGQFEGERLSGQVLPGGGDWLLERADGVFVLDVRLTLRTDDGALIYMTYGGLRHGPPEVLARLATGEPVDPGSYYFRTTPGFETADERYSWLNRIVSVAIGERPPEGPRYTVYEIL
jgi:hypothetical protein